MYVGEDLSMEVDIPFMTAIKGGEHTVRVRRMEACGTCTGRYCCMYVLYVLYM